MLVLMLMIEGGRSWKQNGNRKYREDVSAIFTLSGVLIHEFVID